MRTLNNATLDLIKSFEGCRLKAYKDSVGVWTIGYGHTSAAGGLQVSSGLTITQAQADTLLEKDLIKYQSYVEAAIKVPVNDNQYGAMVSLCYNIGPGNFAKSTVVKKTNASDWKGAAAAFSMWNKAGGKVLAGLTRRRADEAKLYLKPSEKVSTLEVSVPQKSTETPVAPPVADTEPTEKTSWLSALINLAMVLFNGKAGR